ncbi:hypothetical protein L934_04275 [Helicobacter pylori PZ5080]|uniref:Uncharacterized protein n=1 Tax=Helicobacter pylori PZ5080 TaxID=1337394 RepID=T2SKR0_HELPX|nr:hypothetical protein L934_04275 [Helicobacter pylori PZ5080]
MFNFTINLLDFKKKKKDFGVFFNYLSLEC